MENKQTTKIMSKEKPFDGFSFAIRTFWVEGTELTVWRRWSGNSLDPEKPRKLSTSISGQGILEKDSVCVIGSDKQTKEFSLTITSNEEVAQEWERIKEIDEIVTPHGDQTPELRIRKRIYEALDNNPPTAFLFYSNGDWEVGAKSGWAMECKVPLYVLEKLESDIESKKIKKITLGIKWEAGLVKDEHDPPSVPTTWGLWKLQGKDDPEPLHGHVESITWVLSSGTANGS